MQFGRRTVAVMHMVDAEAAAATERALRHASPAEVRGNMARVGRTHPAMARVGRQPYADPRPRSPSARTGYSPGAEVGADCPTQDQVKPKGSQQAWCYGMQDAGPIPLGGGEVSIPAFAAGVNGAAPYTLLPKEGFTIEDITVTDPSGRLLIASVIAGRCDWLENGPIAANALAENKTLCKMLKGFNSFPSTGVVLNFQNPTLAPVPVQVTASGWPIPCPQA